VIEAKSIPIGCNCDAVRIITAAAASSFGGKNSTETVGRFGAFNA
jgi:hypothetical protein